MVQLFINDVQVDLPNLPNPIILSYDMTSPSSPSSYTTTFSKTLSLPLTQVNLNVFSFPLSSLVPSSLSYVLLVNSSKVDSGTVVVSSINSTININFHSSLIELVTKFTNKTPSTDGKDYSTLVGFVSEESLSEVWPVGRLRVRNIGDSNVLASSLIPETPFDDEDLIAHSTYDLYATSSNIGIPSDSHGFNASSFLSTTSDPIELPLPHSWYQTGVNHDANRLVPSLYEFQLQKIMSLRGFFARITHEANLSMTESVRYLLNNKYITLPQFPYNESNQSSYSNVGYGTFPLLGPIDSFVAAVLPSTGFPSVTVPVAELDPSLGYYKYKVKSYLLDLVYSDVDYDVETDSVTLDVPDYPTWYECQDDLKRSISLPDARVWSASCRVISTEILQIYYTKDGMKTEEISFCEDGLCVLSSTGSVLRDEQAEYTISVDIDKEDAYVPNQDIPARSIYSQFTEPFNKFLDCCKQLNLRFRPDGDSWALCTAAEYYDNIISLEHSKSYEVVPVPPGPLPIGYQECEYLESTGTQWIDPGIIPQFDDTISLSVYYSNSNVMWGATNFTVAFSGATEYWRIFKTSGDQIPGTFPFRTWIDYEYSNGVFSSRGISRNRSNYTCTDSLLLFRRRTGAYGSGRISSFIIEGKREFIPALDPNGRPCMFDTISNQPFYNQGTGEFLYQLKFTTTIPVVTDTTSQTPYYDGYLDYTNSSFSPHTFTSKYLSFVPSFNDKSYSLSAYPTYGPSNLPTNYPVESTKEWFSKGSLKNLVSTKFSYRADPADSSSLVESLYGMPAEFLDAERKQLDIPFALCSLSTTISAICIPHNADIGVYCYLSDEYVNNNPSKVDLLSLSMITTTTKVDDGYQELFHLGSPVRDMTAPIKRPMSTSDLVTPSFADVSDLAESSLYTVNVFITKFLFDYQMTFQDFLHTIFHFKGNYWGAYKVQSFTPGSSEAIPVVFFRINHLENYGFKL